MSWRGLSNKKIDGAAIANELIVVEARCRPGHPMTYLYGFVGLMNILLSRMCQGDDKKEKTKKPKPEGLAGRTCCIKRSAVELTDELRHGSAAQIASSTKANNAFKEQIMTQSHHLDDASVKVGTPSPATASSAKNTTVVWDGWQPESPFWVVRSDASGKEGAPGAGAAIFNPQGEWVASLSQPLDEAWRDVGGRDCFELAAMHQGVLLAQKVCPGEPLLILSDSVVALESVRTRGAGHFAQPAAMSVEIGLELARRKKGSMAMWIPREGNRLADSLASLRRRKVEESDRHQALAELDHAFFSHLPARMACDFQVSNRTLILDAGADYSAKRVSTVQFARLAWFQLSPQAQRELASAHASAEIKAVVSRIRGEAQEVATPIPYEADVENTAKNAIPLSYGHAVAVDRQIQQAKRRIKMNAFAKLCLYAAQEKINPAWSAPEFAFAKPTSAVAPISDGGNKNPASVAAITPDTAFEPNAPKTARAFGLIAQETRSSQQAPFELSGVVNARVSKRSPARLTRKNDVISAPQFGMRRRAR